MDSRWPISRTSLAILELDPDDAQAMGALRAATATLDPAQAQERFAAAGKALTERGRPDAAVALLDVQLERLAASEANGQRELHADLLIEKGLLLDEELLDPVAAAAMFEEAGQIRPGDTLAQEALDDLQMIRENWKKFADKFLSEAQGSTDRALSTSMYVSAAANYLRFSPNAHDAPEVSTFLDKALEIDPQNRKALFHRTRLLRRGQQWAELATFWAARAEAGTTRETKVAAHLALAEVAAQQGDAEKARAHLMQVLAMDPAEPRAVRQMRERLLAEKRWPELAELLLAALKMRRGSDEVEAPLWAALAEIQWKQLGAEDAAEDSFKRVRKVDPANQLALDFYRGYYRARNEPQEALADLAAGGEGHLAEGCGGRGAAARAGHGDRGARRGARRQPGEGDRGVEAAVPAEPAVARGAHRAGPAVPARRAVETRSSICSRRRSSGRIRRGARRARRPRSSCTSSSSRSIAIGRTPT